MNNYWLDKKTFKYLTADISDPYIRDTVATLIENQYNCIKTLPDTAWKRCSWLCLKKVFNETFVGHQLVSVQATGGPVAKIKSSAGCHEMPVVIHPAKTRWTYNREDGAKHHTYLDYEMNLACDFSEALQLEITNEIIKNLADNAGIQAACRSEDLLSSIFLLALEMRLNPLSRAPNWIVGQECLIKPIEKHLSFKVIYNDSLSDSVLLGYKNQNNPNDAGYVYAPYSLVNFENRFVSVRRVKKLINASRYGKISIS